MEKFLFIVLLVVLRIAIHFSLKTLNLTKSLHKNGIHFAVILYVGDMFWVFYNDFIKYLKSTNETQTLFLQMSQTCFNSFCESKKRRKVIFATLAIQENLRCKIRFKIIVFEAFVNDEQIFFIELNLILHSPDKFIHFAFVILR